MLQGIGTLGGVVAIVWGAFHAADAWKEQKRAERLLETAERILTATYTGRNGLAYVRQPLMLGHEISAAQETLKDNEYWLRQSEGRQKRLVTAQAFYDRLNRTKDEQNALVECLPMARALFGERVEKALENLRRQFWIVQVAVDSYVDDEGGTDAEFTKQLRRQMYDVSPRAGEKNAVSDEIAEAVSIIEETCMPALRLKSNAARC
jgi:hypothetical protein